MLRQARCMQVLQTVHTMHPDIVANPFHVGIIRSAMTKNLGECFDEVHAEIVDSVADMIPHSKSALLPTPSA